jgi:hypothetical protein
MKMTTVAAALVLGLGLASCNENEQPKASTTPPPTRQSELMNALKNGQTTYSSNVSAPQSTIAPRREVNLPGAAAMPVAPAAGQSPAAAAVADAVQIPKDARYTLYCASIAGGDRFTRMQQLKAYLMAKTPFKEWYVVHNEQESTLFYGFYSAIERTSPGSAGAHEDRRRIAEWKDENGEKPFASCFFTPVIPPTPAAPAEWNLVNAPIRAYWSVQIAAFKDNPQRKQAAIEMVKDLRGRGIEAYFHHGAAISCVCIGAWPADAVRQQDIDGSSAAQAASDQDDAILVSNAPLPARYRNVNMKTADGQRLVPYAQRVEIIDPSLLATMRDYPIHYVNYEAMKKQVKTVDGKMADRISPSFLVKVPRDDVSVLGNGANGANGFLNPTGMPAAPPQDSTRQPAGGGRLRGLGF